MENNTNKAIDELIQFSKDWDNALADNNVKNIGSFMADEWVMVATQGGITSKRDFLNFIKPGALVHTIMDFENIKVDVYGNTGIIVARGTSAGTYKEDAFSYYEWSTSIFQKNEKGWLCVLTMLTPVSPNKA